jgi:hypothetical protein
VSEDEPMEDPRTRVVGEESNGGIASNVTDADNITHDRVDIVVVSIDACTLHHAEGMLYDTRNQCQISSH